MPNRQKRGAQAPTSTVILASGESSDKKEIMRATFNEDGNIVEMEAIGQLTEFTSEIDTEEDTESDKEGEEIAEDSAEYGDEEPSELNRNTSTNMVGPFHNRAAGGVYTSKFDEPSDVTIAPLPLQVTGSGESQGYSMKDFVEYMKVEGLVMVKASKANRQNKFQKPVLQGQLVAKTSKNQGKQLRKGNIIELMDTAPPGSEVTVYHNTVLPESSKQDSSSSEEALDTSDEVDKLPLQLITVTQDHNNKIVEQFITENNPEERAWDDQVAHV